MVEMVLRVLMIEDSDDDARLIVRELQRGGYTVEWQRVETQSEMEDALRQQPGWDIMISDHNMPQFSSSHALQLLKESGHDIPFVIVSGSIGEDAAVTALKSGAHDFLIKGHLARLVPAIQRELREAESRRERKKAERDLQSTQERLSGILTIAPDAIIVVNEDHQIILFNQSAENIFGYRAEEVSGKPLEILLPPRTVDSYRHRIDEFLASIQNMKRMGERFEIFGRRKDGSEFPAEVSISMLRQGDEVTLTVIMRDITDRKQRERELETIATVSSALRVVKTLDEMLTLLLEQSMLLLEGTFGSIWLYNPSENQMDLAAYQGWEPVDIVTSLKMDEDIPGLVVTSGEAIVSRDFSSDPRVFPKNREKIPEGVGGACVPLHAEENVIGAMFLNVMLPREIAADEMRLLNALAEIGGSAINRLRLHEQTVRQLERLEALRRIDMAITNSLDLRITLDIVLEEALRLLGVDAASVLVMRPGIDQLEFVNGRGFLTHASDFANIPLGQGFAGKAALEQQMVRVPYIFEDEDTILRKNMLLDEGFVSYFGVPLIAKGEVQGVLEVFCRSRLDPDREWETTLESIGWQTAVAVDNALLFRGMQRSNIELKSAYDATIEGWSRALDLRDKETEGHTLRVTETTLKLARVIGVHDEDLVHIRRGALLHDIGKMGVPDSILFKPDQLTEEEWEIMRKHPEFAYEMLASISYLRNALEIPYCHHEKWDGTGYPRGLKGNLIPLAARIFAIADVWDAVTSDRPYRKAWSPEKALEYIREQSGIYFDPQIVEVFLASPEKYVIF